MLDDRRDVNLLNFMYKRKSNSLLLQERPRELRKYEADVFTEHYSNNNTFAKSVIHQGAKKWNALPIEEKLLLTLESFKDKQKCKLKN